MDKDNDLKEMITLKTMNFIKSNNESKKNEKYQLKEFSDIRIKPVSSAITMFYHPMYKDVKLHVISRKTFTTSMRKRPLISYSSSKIVYLSITTKNFITSIRYEYLVYHRSIQAKSC